LTAFLTRSVVRSQAFRLSLKIRPCWHGRGTSWVRIRYVKMSISQVRLSNSDFTIRQRFTNDQTAMKETLF